MGELAPVFLCHALLSISPYIQHKKGGVYNFFLFYIPLIILIIFAYLNKNLLYEYFTSINYHLIKIIFRIQLFGTYKVMNNESYLQIYLAIYLILGEFY